MSRDSTELNAILDLCRTQHCRTMLAVLAEERRTLTLNDLSKAVLKYEYETPVTAATEDELAEIRLSLYHFHIPKLASEGVVEYDHEREHVVPTARFDELQPALATILEAEASLQEPVRL